MKINKWLILISMVLVLSVGVYFVFAQSQTPITKTANITLTVTAAPDFTLTTNIQHIDTFVNRTISFVATVDSVDGFAGVVDFAVTGLPPEMAITYLPSQSLTLGTGETKGIQVDIVVPDDANLIGGYTIVITATSTNYN